MTSNYDLDTVLLNFFSNKGSTAWTIRDAVEGLQILGGIGSGKSSGSGEVFALRFLENGFGGLVLTVKADEKETWVRYARQTGRQKDLIIVEPGGKHAFNFLEYEAQQQFNSRPITENIVDVLKTVIRAGQDKNGGKSDDPFWETALDMLIFNAIDLCLLAYGKVSISLLYEIVQAAPQREAITEDHIRNYKKAFEAAQMKVLKQVEKLESALSPRDRANLTQEDFENMITDKLSDAALLKQIDQFFMETYRNLSEKTRSIIEFSFSGFLFRLLKEPVYSLLCRLPSTFRPEDSLDGKIILLNLPVKQFNKVGRDCQILFKYIWQRAMEKRNVHANGRPVFLWADEAQHFLHEHDAEYQATARGSRIATVYLSQNLPNYHANMGGGKSAERVKAFLGTLGTKIFHANADLDTNKYASELIGSGYGEDISASYSMSGRFSYSQTKSYKLESCVRPEEFIGLRTGGPRNNYIVQAYIHMQGKRFHNGLSYLKIALKQSQL